MDDGALDAVLEAAIADSAGEWQRYCDGDDKLAQFFVGKVMAATKGKANGKAVIAAIAARRP